MSESLQTATVRDVVILSQPRSASSLQDDAQGDDPFLKNRFHLIIFGN